MIAGIALKDVEAVSMRGVHFKEDKTLDKGDLKNLKKNIRFIQHEKGIKYEISVSVKYGANIEETSKEVQTVVFDAVERNIGVKPYKVNVVVNGIEF
jgi:uncharacterized alkaline shock family protein YloU